MAALRKKAGAHEAGVPAGYTQIQTGSFPPNWDFEKNPILKGKVTEVKSVPQKRGKKTVQVKILYVADANGEVHAVWESSQLESFMSQVKPKNDVYIKFLGVKKLGKKKTLKEYQAAVKQ
jgi:hypothetical protein